MFTIVYWLCSQPMFLCLRHFKALVDVCCDGVKFRQWWKTVSDDVSSTIWWEIWNYLNIFDDMLRGMNPELTYIPWRFADRCWLGPRLGLTWASSQGSKRFGSEGLECWNILKILKATNGGFLEWRYPQMDGLDNLIKVDDLGVPLFQETHKWWSPFLIS